MPSDIGIQLADAVDDLHAPHGLAGAIIATSRSHRRRRVVAAGVMLAAAVVAAVVVPIATGGHSPDVNRVVPIASEPPALASVNGVDVTWLPDGFRVLPFNPNEGTYFSAFEGLAISRNFEQTSSTRLRMAVGVQRGTELNLDQLRHDQVSPGGAITTVTVRGHQGVLVGPASQQPGEYLLYWVEQPRLSIGIEGQTLSDVMGVAKGLFVHSAPAPAGDPAAAVSLIRNAFRQAYTGSEQPATKLAAIEDGERLAPVLSQLTQQLPDTVRTTTVATAEVAFMDARQALVQYTLTFHYQGGPVSETGSGTAVLDNGVWKVSEATYCNSVQRPGVTLACPPR